MSFTHFDSLDDLSKDDVEAIKLRSRSYRYSELRPTRQLSTSQISFPTVEENESEQDTVAIDERVLGVSQFIGFEDGRVVSEEIPLVLVRFRAGNIHSVDPLDTLNLQQCSIDNTSELRVHIIWRLDPISF